MNEYIDFGDKISTIYKNHIYRFLSKGEKQVVDLLINRKFVYLDVEGVVRILIRGDV